MVQSVALIRKDLDPAPDPLRGDPDDEQHRRLVKLIRPAAAVRSSWGPCTGPDQSSAMSVDVTVDSSQ